MAIKMSKLRKSLLDGEITVDDLQLYTGEFLSYADQIITGKAKNQVEVEAFLRLCLDAYAFSSEGKVLIPDQMYDQCMNVWKQSHDIIVYADDIMIDSSGKWELQKHKAPGIVGTLPKIYTYDELKVYLKDMRLTLDVETFVLSPKYDGISVSIELGEDGKIKRALTRYDGVNGQDITRVIERASNADSFWRDGGLVDPLPGFYKCECVIATCDFDKLVEEKKYSNRRSAVSGIVSSPKNVHLGKYLTLLPLLYWDTKGNPMYIAPGSRTYQIISASDLYEHLTDSLDHLRNSKFPYRVDGIVMYPMSKLAGKYIDENNLMGLSTAYKVNTAEAKTIVEDVYPSIGRLGNMIPMAKVRPVEVNETIVTDISLGSYAKFKSLDLFEGKEVIVYSAGDCIPQLKNTGYTNNVYDRDFFKIQKVCSYCGKKLSKVHGEYRCDNPECIRVITGKLANFASKVGFQNFSDKTFEDLYKAKLVREIPDIFRLQVSDIMEIDGYDKVSATNFVEEATRVMSDPISLSTLFGALGIPKISSKKCRRIFEYISLSEVMDFKKSKIVNAIIEADGVGLSTAETFAEFIHDNKDMIRDLLKMMTIKPDRSVKGNVVFTGFRDPEWDKKFEELGYEPAHSVTGKTVAVVSASSSFTSGNCKAAIKKGIPIYLLSDIDELYRNLYYGNTL